MAHTVVVEGDCLAPRVRAGDRLYLTEHRPLVPGAIAAAELATGAVLLGELARWDGRWWLTSAGLVPIRLDAAVRLLGVAEGLLRQV